MRVRIVILMFCFATSAVSAKLEYYFSPGLVGLIASLNTGDAAFEAELNTISDNFQFTSGPGSVPINIPPLTPGTTDRRFVRGIQVPLNSSDADFANTQSLFLTLGTRWRERFHFEGLLVPSISVPIEISIPAFSQTYYVVDQAATQLAAPDSCGIEVPEKNFLTLCPSLLSYIVVNEEELSSEQISGEIGEVDLLFFIFSGTYTPIVSSVIKPYMGAGFLLMLARDTNINQSQATLTNAKFSFEDPIAVFLQVGGFLPLRQNWELFVDLKQVLFQSALKIDDVVLDTGTSIFTSNNNIKIDFELRATMIELGMRYYF